MEEPIADFSRVFLFVLWEKARSEEARVTAEVAANFRVLEDFEATWPRGEFVSRLGEFYDERNWWKWFKKAWRCGRGPMRVLVVEDPAPRFELRSPHSRTPENMRVVDLKNRCRTWIPCKWAIHASTEAVETRRQYRLLKAAKRVAMTGGESVCPETAAPPENRRRR